MISLYSANLPVYNIVFYSYNRQKGHIMTLGWKIVAYHCQWQIENSKLKRNKGSWFENVFIFLAIKASLELFHRIAFSIFTSKYETYSIGLVAYIHTLHIRM